MGRGREEGSSHSPPRAYCYFHRDTKREPVQRRGATAIFPLEPWRATMAQWWEHSPPTDVTRVQISASTTYVGVEFVDGSLPCSDSKTARNVIVGWKTKTCTILCPPHSVFLRIYVVKLGTLRYNDATATRTSLKKWICVLSVSIAIIPTHLLCQL